MLYSSSGSSVGPLMLFYGTYFSAQLFPFATLAVFVIFTFVFLPSSTVVANQSLFQCEGHVPLWIPFKVMVRLECLEPASGNIFHSTSEL